MSNKQRAYLYAGAISATDHRAIHIKAATIMAYSEPEAIGRLMMHAKAVTFPMNKGFSNHTASVLLADDNSLTAAYQEMMQARAATVPLASEGGQDAP